MEKFKKKYLFICQSKSCLKSGSEHIKRSIKKYLKENELKKEIRLVNTKCMDACKNGPNVVCANTLFQNVDEENLKEIINLCTSLK